MKFLVQRISCALGLIPKLIFPCVYCWGSMGTGGKAIINQQSNRCLNPALVQAAGTFKRYSEYEI